MVRSFKYLAAIAWVLAASTAFAACDCPTATAPSVIVRCDRDTFVVKNGDKETEASWGSVDSPGAHKLLTDLHVAREKLDPQQLDAAARFKIAAALCRVGHQTLGRATIQQLIREDPSLKPQADELFADLGHDLHAIRRAARVNFEQHPAAAKYALEIQPARTIQATMTYSITAPALTAKDWLLIAPMPPALSCQNNITGSLSPQGARERELSAGRTVLTARYSPSTGSEKNSFAATATYRADLFSRRLVAHPNGPNRYTDPSAGKYLSATPEMNFDAPVFRSWLTTHALRPVDGESDVDFARRVFASIKRGLNYDYAKNMDRRIDSTCQLCQTDCGGLSMIFVSAMRASGIPARLLAGRWAMSAKPGEQVNGIAYYQWHVKAEFYSASLGWVPVDCASAILHDRDGDGSRFFGNDPGNFLVMHIDNDIVLDTPCGQKMMPWLQDIVCWASGQGSFDNDRVSEDWRVAERAIASTD